MNSQDFKYAARAADMSNYKRVHIGCMVVIGDKIVSSGYNQIKTHTLQAKYNNYRNFSVSNCINSIHAEIDCLRFIQYRNIKWHKVKLYISRCKANGETGMARPCPACMMIIKKLGIKNIYYTTDDGYAYEKIS